MGACWSTGISIFPSNGAPKRLTREHIHALDKYMPDFRIYEVSTEHHRHIAATHWNEVFREEPSGRSARSSQSTGRPKTTSNDSRISTLYDLFYQYLDEHSPQLKPVFRSSMHVRSKVLVHISAGMRSILASDQVLDKSAALTKTHLRFGVKLEYFNALGNALLHAMRVASEDAWTPEIEDAWRRLFTHCCAILLVQHKKALDRKAVEKQVNAHEEQSVFRLGPVVHDLGKAKSSK